MAVSALETLASWGNALLGLFYPEVCQLCSERRATPAQGYVCAQCEAGIDYITPPFCDRCGLPHEGAITVAYRCGNCADLELHFDHARSAARASGPLLEAIHAYKYRRAVWLEPFLTRVLLRAAVPGLRAQGWDLVVPVPLHCLKEREREFNQSERLARALARALELPVEPRALRRVIPTRTQTRLSREERRGNVKNAFQVSGRGGVQGRRVILVDDVFTTGSTTNECARALRVGGAHGVCVWTLARGV